MLISSPWLIKNFLKIYSLRAMSKTCVYLREKVGLVNKEMSAVNFLAHSSLGAFPAAGDQQLPWLPVEEGPDLLDRLIQVPK